MMMNAKIRKMATWVDSNLMFITAGLLVLVVMFMSGQLGSNSAETLSGRISLIIGYVALITAGVTMLARLRELDNGPFKTFIFVWIGVLLVLEIFASLSFILANDASTEAKHDNYKLNQIERALSSSEQSVSIAQANWEKAIEADSKYQTRRFNQYQDALDDYNALLTKYEKMSAKYTASSLVVYERIALLLDNKVQAKTIQFIMRSLFMIAISVTVIALVSMLSQLKAKRELVRSPTAPGSGPNGGKKRTKAEDDTTERVSEKEILNAPQSAPVTAEKSAPHRTAPAASEAQTGATAKAQLCEREYKEFLGMIKSGAVRPSYRAVKAEFEFVKSDDKAGKFLNRAAKEGHLIKETQNNRTRFKLSDAVRTEMDEPQKLKLVR